MDVDTYSFGRRSGGIFIGLDGRGLVLAAGLVLAVVAVWAAAGPLPAGLLAVVGLAGLWAPGPGGLPLRTWATATAAWAWRVVVATPTPTPTFPSTSDHLPPGVTAIDADGLVDLGGTWAGCWALTGGQDAALAGPDQLDEALRRWGGLLDQLVPPTVRAVQWAVSSTPDPAAEPAAWLAAHRAGDADPAAVADYANAIAALGAVARRREAHVVVVVAPKQRTAAAARTELARVGQLLQGAQLQVRRVDGAELRRIVRLAAAPGLAALPVPPSRLPEASVEDAATFRTAGGVHRTVVAVELPRVAVAGDWLWPLLAAQPPERTWRVAVAMHATGLPPWRALRAAETAVTSAESELRRRQKAGFATRSRDLLALEGQASREEEVARGHSSWRLQLSVTVSALSESALAEGVAAVAAALRAARCESALAVGQQAAGWRASLPLGLPGVGPSVTATSRAARSLCPAIVALGTPGSGVALGLDALAGGPYAFDPWAAYSAGLLTNPNLAVFGRVGRGKSTLVKLLLLRSAGVFGRRAWVLDPKGEYGPLGAALGLPVIRLGAGTRLNPLDVPAGMAPDVAAAKRSSLLLALAASLLARPPTIAETRAVEQTCADLEQPDPVLADVVDALLHPAARTAKVLGSTPDQVAAEARPVALALQRLTSGALAGMFDGPSTVAPGVGGGIVDLSATYADEAALAPILAAAISWVTSALASGGAQPTYVVVDEAWRVLAGGVDFLRSSAKLSRSLGCSLVLVMHHLADLSAAGDSGSATATKAELLFADVETVAVFGEHLASDSPAVGALDLSEREVELVGQLQRGRALVVSGGTHRLVDLVPTARELDLADTDAAMRSAAASAQP